MATRKQTKAKRKGEPSEAKLKGAKRPAAKRAETKGKPKSVFRMSEKGHDSRVKAGTRARLPGGGLESDGHKATRQKLRPHLENGAPNPADAAVDREGEHAAATADRRALPRSPGEDIVVRRLYEALERHATESKLGHVAVDAQFDWGEETENPDLHPDLAFVSFDRWAAYRTVPQQLTWHVVPELVVEIRRAADSQDDFKSRLENYFNAGVQRVWLVDPSHKKVHDHESASSARVVDEQEAIDGGQILPGFSYPVGELVASEQRS
jgi:hypothetical protein